MRSIAFGNHPTATVGMSLLNGIEANVEMKITYKAFICLVHDSRDVHLYFSFPAIKWHLMENGDWG